MKALQVPDEPPADADPATVVVIQGRCPDGSKIMRRFTKATTTVRDMENWCRREKQIGTGQAVTVMTAFPKKALDNLN